MSDWRWPWIRKAVHHCGYTIRLNEDLCGYCETDLTDYVLHGCGAQVWVGSVCWNACGRDVIPFQLS